MTSAAAQKFNAITNTNVPTIPAVAKDPAVVKFNSYLKPSIATVARVPRPSTVLGAKYTNSKAIYQGINQILNGRSASSVLPSIQSKLERIVPPLGEPTIAGEDGIAILPRPLSCRPSRPQHQSPAVGASRRSSSGGRRGSPGCCSPSLAVVAFVAIYPLGKTVYQSFTDQQFLALEPANWVGLRTTATSGMTRSSETPSGQRSSSR